MRKIKRKVTGSRNHLKIRKDNNSSSTKRQNLGEIDHELQDFDIPFVRCKPEGLDELCMSTNFSRKELQIMYRGFKQECPTGIVDEETFKEIYAQFFPQGDSTSYAHYVFNTFDIDGSGYISFEDFVMGLSVLSRGSLQERLHWAFNLYDINGDGMITRDEMLLIISAVYEMMGRFTEPIIEDTSTLEHVDLVFKKMDSNQDGVITYEEFMDACHSVSLLKIRIQGNDLTSYLRIKGEEISNKTQLQPKQQNNKTADAKTKRRVQHETEKRHTTCKHQTQKTTHKPTRPMGNRCRLWTAICQASSKWCGYPGLRAHNPLTSPITQRSRRTYNCGVKQPPHCKMTSHKLDRETYRPKKHR
ncbi:hypothetical protein FSP39_016201 [Pinctada imbricata]|uniref:EF-hand domain-containing protein n=1 Tax=Pinctada imbricata TaxID=66713 RepID=A0AA88YFB7_PINIB|nr:hypothetical protein FSP39_016201 [Pinctada imbricata]